MEGILQAASEILVTEGYSGLTTNRIAEIAGVSIGSLYQYFPNKTAIAIELVRRKRSNLSAGIAEALEGEHERSFEETLRRLVDATITHQLQWPRLAHALDQAQAFLPLQAETMALNARMVRTVGAFLARAGKPSGTTTVRDLIAIVRGMVETAGLAGETDRHDLSARVMRAASGYLG